MTRPPDTPDVDSGEDAGDPAPSEDAEAGDLAPAEDGPDTAEERSPGGPRRSRWWRMATGDGAVAALTWLVATPLGVLLVRAADLDPFSVRGVVMPVGVGAVAGGIVFALLLWRRSERLIGLAMGLYASWIGLTMAAALHGTPYGYGSLSGDQGRFVAMAMKYTQEWHSTDSFAKGLPTEYPPLYPWLVGHLAALVDRPAWQLFGETQIVCMSGAMIAAYLMWRRLVPPVVAFTLVGLAPAVFNQPSKDYEFLALVVFIPWVIGTFAAPRPFRGSLHWLPAGVIGGLIVLTYQAWLLYSALGLLALIVLNLRLVTERRAAYLLHLLGVAVTAFAVASWYVVPFLWMLLTKGGERVSDFWMSPAIVDRPLVLPFMQSTPIAVVQLVGLLGMVWYRRRTVWATPVILVVVGNYAYRALFLLKTAQDNHTGYLQYTETLIGMSLLVAGVLTTVESLPALRRLVVRLVAARPDTLTTTSRERAVAVTGVTAIVVWAAFQGWPNWVPGPRGLRDSVRPPGVVNRATDAHAEHLPNGKRTRFAPPTAYVYSPYPSSAIHQVITAQLGEDADPVVLATDQRLFAFYPYDGYTSSDRVSANTLLRWDEREAEIARLATITDPVAFADASRSTAFGPIDVFILRKSATAWRWKSVSFQPTVFDSAHFHVEALPSGFVIAVRRA